MPRALKRRIALGVSVAALVTGGAIAAVSATGENDSSSPVFAHHGHRPGPARLLQPASAYLGIPPTQLKARLESGETLAQVATQTSGKSEAGLVAALVSARSAKLAKAASQVDARVRAAVNRPLFDPGERGGKFRAGALGYLDLTAAQLTEELRSGKTLAEIANASPRKSQVGLVEAIVAARSARLNAEVSSGKLSKASASTDLARLTKRVLAFVDRSHVKRK